MKEKRLGINIPDTYNYIRIFNGLMDLTDMEMKILAEFIDLKKSLDKAGIGVNPFSTEMKKKVAERLGRNDFNTLNNYIKSFADKGATVKTDDGYQINSTLIPSGGAEKITIVVNEQE